MISSEHPGEILHHTVHTIVHSNIAMHAVNCACLLLHVGPIKRIKDFILFILFFSGHIADKGFANSSNLFRKMCTRCTVQQMYLLCHVVERNRSECVCVCCVCVCVCVCSLFWPLSVQPWLACSDTQFIVLWFEALVSHYAPNFLCPCAAKISLCVCVNHLSYAHAPLRKGQGCHLIPATSLSYLCVSYSRPLAVSQLGYPSTLFIPVAPTIWT